MFSEFFFPKIVLLNVLCNVEKYDGTKEAADGNMAALCMLGKATRA
jgi:hypothetical protein